jgi:hypothetical protein
MAAGTDPFRTVRCTDGNLQVDHITVPRTHWTPIPEDQCSDLSLQARRWKEAFERAKAANNLASCGDLDIEDLLGTTDEEWETEDVRLEDAIDDARRANVRRIVEAYRRYCSERFEIDRETSPVLILTTDIEMNAFASPDGLTDEALTPVAERALDSPDSVHAWRVDQETISVMSPRPAVRPVGGSPVRPRW